MPPRITHLPALGAADFAAAGLNEDGGDASLLSFLSFDPCLFPVAPVAVPINRRRRSGTATLCGIAEFTAPSTPPIAYRTQTLSSTNNGVAGCQYNAGCAAPGVNGGFRYTAQGQFVYSAVDCSTVNTMTESFYPSDGASFCGTSPTPSSTTPMLQPWQPSNISTAVQTLTPNTNTWTYPGTCSGSNQIFNGNAIATLSNPDTEADAIVRLQATTAWVPAVGFGFCATPPSCCLASWQIRTGLSFFYGDCQFSINATGLPANTRVCGAVDIFRRVYGVPPYVLFETIFVNGATDGAGNLALTGDVPNARGFETYFDNPRYFPPP
jgi:hypothetical protein